MKSLMPKEPHMNNNVTPVLFVAIFLAAASIGKSELPAAAQPLSVAETIALVDQKPVDTIPDEEWSKWERPNPDARPAILEILRDGKQRSRWSGATRILSHMNVAGDETVLAELPWRCRPGYDTSDARSTGEALDGLGLMAQRGNTHARELLLQMAMPDHWRGIRSQIAELEPADELSRELQYAHAAFTVVKRRLPAQASELPARMLAQVKDPKQRQLLRHVLDRDVRSLAEPHSRGKPSVASSPADTVNDRGAQASPDTEERVAEMLANPHQTILAAKEAYDVAWQMLQQPDKHAALALLANNGMPLVMTAADKDRVAGKLEKHQGVLELTESVVKEMREKRKADGIAELKKISIDGRPAVKVIVPQLQTRDLVTKYHLDSGSVAVVNGDLAVVMLWLDDRWFWNPPGW